jgi:hypothetical protein
MVDLNSFRREFLSASEFSDRAFNEMDVLTADQYWMRARDRMVKKLVEEVLPLAMVARYLDIPGRRVSCKYFGESEDDCDGQILVDGEWVTSGFMEARYYVEITAAQFEREHLLREALVRYGSVFDDPKIHREGSKFRGDDRIVSNAVARDGDQEVLDSLSWINAAVQTKVKNRYLQPCMLIVSLSPGRPLSLGEWTRIVNEFPRAVTRERFNKVFLVDASAGVVHHAS